ncbi:MAG: sugar ABC transporter substrate-binding protein [Chloroflexota bacterium]
MNGTAKRIRNLGAASLFSLLSLTGCGTEAATPTTEPVPTGSAVTSGSTPEGKKSASGDISFQVFGDPAELAVFQAVVEGYKEVNPAVNVKINHVPAQGEHMTKISAGFAAGNPPDVFLLNYRRYGQFAAKNVLEPLGNWLDKSTTLKASDYYTQSLNAFTYEGTVQCIPQNISSLGVYYNKDLFEKNNLPLPTADWTWGEFLNAAQVLTLDTNGDGITDIHGVGVEPVIIRLAPFVWSRGGEIVDNTENPTKLTLDTPEAREAIDFFMNMSRLYRVVPTEPEIKAEALDTRFMNGKIGMYLASRVETPIFRNIKGFTWDVAPLPTDQTKVTILHSDAYCVAASSKNKEAAWDFIEYAQGTKGQEVASRLGRIVPSLKSVSTSPAFLDPTQPPANSQMYLDAVPNIRLVPISAAWPAVETVVNKELERAFFGTATVDEAIQLAMQKANEEFGKVR